jgi:REP element-mobilizing transposase RayT
MKRPKRKPVGWHVMARGCRRLELFRDAEDYRQFLAILKYALEISGCILWAYTLMTNHYHLVLYGSSEALTACMRRVNGLYSSYHNRRYGHSGHAFDGPYLAYPQFSLVLLLRTIAYVLLNPLGAGWKRSLEEYPWSSYRSYRGRPGDPLAVDVSDVMRRVHADPKVAWDLFWKAMEREAQRLATRPKKGPSMADVHGEQFEWLLEHARERRADLGGVRATLVAMHWGRQVGISPRAIARVLGEPDVQKVRDQLRWIKRRLESDPDLAERAKLP